MLHWRRILLHCAAPFALLASRQTLNAQSQAPDSLKGITSVSVLIEELPSGATKLGLMPSTIQTDVELKLRLAGMKVLAQSFISLYVSVNATPDGRAENITVELLQPVTLNRDSSIVVWTAITWIRQRVALLYNSQDIREAVKDEVDTFLNDWLSVNPKK
jgi:hypothetical protein